MWHFATNELKPNAELIKGVVCGIRVEEGKDPLMQKIRCLYKLIDKLAQGQRLIRSAAAANCPKKLQTFAEHPSDAQQYPGQDIRRIDR